MDRWTWIVIGSSPLARESYAAAKARFSEAQVITCNRGLSVEPDPDFFFLSDQGACDLWSADGKKTANRNGKTKTITLRRDPQAMKMRKVDDFDLVVREGFPFEPFQMSGIWCVEFAIRFGRARRVVLCGMDGYRKELGVTDYFPGAHRIEDNEGKGLELTSKVVHPLSDRIARKYPTVHFLQIGAPCYEINLPNWEVALPSP